jgi:hypothetical protein
MRASAAQAAPSRFVLGVAAIAGAVTLGIGLWSLFGTRSFADFADFGYHEHFLHDIGAFQIGLGAMLLIAVAWRDSLATVLAAFLVGNTIHVGTHIADTDLGGSTMQWVGLAALSLVIGAALLLRLRELGAPIRRS